MLKQRILRHPSFRKPTYTSDNDSYFQITPLSNLKGKPVGRFLVFGMLTQLEDGKLHLEDTDGSIELKFKDELKQSEGVFTLNCFVLVEGIYDQSGV
jgi:DNA polymerase epsilon subunit 2